MIGRWHLWDGNVANRRRGGGGDEIAHDAARAIGVKLTRSSLSSITRDAPPVVSPALCCSAPLRSFEPTVSLRPKIRLHRNDGSLVLEAHPVRIEPLIGFEASECDPIRCEQLNVLARDPGPEPVPEVVELPFNRFGGLGPVRKAPAATGHCQEKVAPVRNAAGKLVPSIESQVDPLNPPAVPLQELPPRLGFASPTSIESRRECGSGIAFGEPLGHKVPFPSGRRAAGASSIRSSRGISQRSWTTKSRAMASPRTATSDNRSARGFRPAAPLMAGNVFLATANPATLMTIGAGVGAAVIGPTGIVAQAPFIAAGGALMPVVAPVMLFATVSSVMMCARLDRAQETLGRMFEVVERVRHLLEAEDFGRFETAAERIDEIRSEFEECRLFASDVPDRLAKIDHDVAVLRFKYGSLIPRNVDSEGAAREAVSDLKRFFLASLYDVQIDVLQLYLAIQNDADVVESRRSRLREKIARYREDFGRVLEDDPVGAYHRELKKRDGRSGWRRIPDWAKSLGSRKGAEVRRVRSIRRDFDKVGRQMEQWVETTEAATDESRRRAVVFVRSPNGKRPLRAYHTGEIRVEPVAP